MLLNEIAISGFTGTAPTPVEKVAINKYFMNNDLFNLMEFVNQGMASNLGNLQVSVLTYNKPDDAQFRQIGDEYDLSNNVPVPVNFILKQLGGAFQTDVALERAFSQNPEALSNWTEQQIGQKINAIITAFAKYFIRGNSTINPNEFDGLMKFFAANPGQVAATLELDGGLTVTNSLDVERYLNELTARIQDGVTCVITTRLKGKPFLQALEQHRHRGINAIKINSRDYHTFMGIPIVSLEDNCFDAATLGAGIPFIFARFDESKGIRVAVPMSPGIKNHGAILYIRRPDGTTSGTMVKTGAVEMMCVPIIADPFCVSMGIIKEKKTP